MEIENQGSKTSVTNPDDKLVQYKASDTNISQLLGVPNNDRDEAWEDLFLKALASSKLALVSDTPLTGPDGWPYLAVELSEKGQDFNQLCAWLGDRGIGMVINPRKDTPDYVLSYGMIWHYVKFGELLSTVNGSPGALGKIENLGNEQKFEIVTGTKVHAGEPSEEYLPIHVRGILREFLNSNGMQNPRVLVMSTDFKNYDLCISLESLNNPPEAEHQVVLEAISWFLPAHYSLVLISEEGLPKFYSL